MRGEWFEGIPSSLNLPASVECVEGIFGIAIARIFERGGSGTIYFHAIVEHVEGILGIATFQHLECGGSGTVNLLSLLFF